MVVRYHGSAAGWDDRRGATRKAIIFTRCHHGDYPGPAGLLSQYGVDGAVLWPWLARWLPWRGTAPAALAPAGAEQDQNQDEHKQDKQDKQDKHKDVAELVQAFVEALAAEPSFGGEISTAWSDRVVHATDNSIFELMPQGVIYCRSEADIVATMRLLGQEEFREITVTPRGGGTSTNGQSLGSGLVLDTTKYMHAVMAVGDDWARVQAGVVLDVLNRRLHQDGRMFGPSTSSSSRVCLGGMIHTDASGIGSMVWGKTSDHILALRMVLVGGEVITLNRQMRVQDQPRLARLTQIIRGAQSLFYAKLPQLPRFFSGYNLLCAHPEGELWNLVKLVAGSEGSLGVVSECTVRTVPRLKAQVLFGLVAEDMATCLELADDIRELKPYAMELIDENILGTALEELSVQPGGPAYELCQQARHYPNACALFVSLQDHGQEATPEYAEAVRKIQDYLDGCGAVYSVMTSASDQIEQLWNIRKKSVGLYGRRAVEAGRKAEPPQALKGVAFVEDCAVLPRQMGGFIRDFRALLTSHGVKFGMYGHVDAGCIHVRPRLDYYDPQLKLRLRQISDDVFALTRRYGGLLWGEHGKGFRCEYLPEVLGDELYDVFRQIKESFDPYYQLNPGKICQPPQLPLTLDHLPLRAHLDTQIRGELGEYMQAAMGCDGNGMCFSEDATAVMCPSYKATRQRVHSPKGRAALVRRWMHGQVQDAPTRKIMARAIRAEQNIGKGAWWWRQLRRRSGIHDIQAQQTYAAFAGCLACKGCTRGCPLHVDIPEVKSRFLYLYHQFYRRSLRDYSLGLAETLLPFVARVYGLRKFYQGLQRRWGVALARWIGVTELPTLHQPAVRPSPSRDADVVIVPDLLSYVMMPGLTAVAASVLRKLQYQVAIAPYMSSGKSWHSLGFRRMFRASACRNIRSLQLQQARHPQAKFMALDPGLGLVWRQEYQQVVRPGERMVDVWLPQELLGQVSEAAVQLWRPQLAQRSRQHHVYLLVHCFEDSALSGAAAQWLAIFKRLDVAVEHKAVGCCGMAGFWGYQREFKHISAQIFASSWQAALTSIQHVAAERSAQRVVVLVTGGSCRHQLERFYCAGDGASSQGGAATGGMHFCHPLEYLAELISSDESESG